MTEKQQSILNSALSLFADKGFDAVPTSLIAKDAGVSEGLIFRHFENKAGLLNAIMKIGEEKMKEELARVSLIESPGERVMAIMELPFHIDEIDYPFWRLVYSLKWQRSNYNEELAQPIREMLAAALTELKYADIEAEVDLIESYLDGFATTILLKGDSVNKERLLQTLRKKYN